MNRTGTPDNVGTPAVVRPAQGFCSRRDGDRYAPDEHDGSFPHARTDNCANFEALR